MTWGEIQIESLKKMFLNKEVLDIEDLEDYRYDKKYKTYLDAMPQAFNEAVNYIISVAEPIVKEFNLIKTDVNANYNLKNLISDYKSFYDIDTNSFWNLKTKDIIRIEDWINGDVKVYYEAYPKKIDNLTTDDETIELEEKYARLIPLYIAGELYKDDDLTLATVYMNEFLTNLEVLNSDIHSVNNRIKSVFRME